MADPQDILITVGQSQTASELKSNESSNTSDKMQPRTEVNNCKILVVDLT